VCSILIHAGVEPERRGEGPEFKIGGSISPLVFKGDFLDFFFLGNNVVYPGSGAFLTPRSGIQDGKKSGSGSRIQDEHPGLYFQEHGNNFWVKNFKFFDADPDPGSFRPWTRDGKIRILDPEKNLNPQHC
jgi:hypothetical protein